MEWRRELVDLGGPNTLLWFDPDSPGVLDLSQAHPGGLAKVLAGNTARLGELVREPGAHEAAVARGQTITAHADTLAAERGLQTCYLALGMATWHVASSGPDPLAPVLLRRCTLVPHHDSAGVDLSLELADRIELNPVLLAFLERDQGIRLDPDHLLATAATDLSFDPEPVWQVLAEHCANIAGFQIRPSLVIAGLPHEKAPAVADLWGLEHRDEGDLLAALALGEPDPEPNPRATVIPEPLSPDRFVLDVGEDEQRVLDDLARGHHVCVRAPAGTMASRLIASAVAQAVSQGQRVLLVAEKRAAIEAVRDQLDTVALADAVLHLSDPAGTFDAADLTGRWHDRPSYALDPVAAEERRQHRLALVHQASATLDAHARCLHEIRDPWGVSVHQAQEAIAALAARSRAPHSRVRLPGPVITGLTDPEETGERVRHLARIGAWPADRSADPWWRARVGTPAEARQAKEVIGRIITEIDELDTAFDRVMADLHPAEVRTIDDRGEILRTLAQVHDTLEVFQPRVFDEPLNDLIAAVAGRHRADGSQIGRIARMREVRRARSLLRPGLPPEDLQGALQAAENQRVMWRALTGGGGRPRVPDGLDRAVAAHTAVDRDLRWLSARLTSTPDGGDLTAVDLIPLRARLGRLARASHRIDALPQAVDTIAALDAAGLRPLVDDLAARAVGVDDVVSEVAFVWWTSVVDEISRVDPGYGDHDGAAMRRALATYVREDREVQRDNAARITEGIRAGMRATGRRCRADAHWVADLANDSARPVSNRQAIERAGDVLAAVSPCWAISPLAVAAVIPQTRLFDLVIIDDAARTTTARVASSLLRGSQALVIGDPDQLPPTGFHIAAGGSTPTVIDGVSAYAAGAARWGEQSLRFLDNQAGETLALVNAYRDEPLHSVPGRLPAKRFRQDGDPTSTAAVVERVIGSVAEHARTLPGASLGVVAMDEDIARQIRQALADVIADDEDLGRWVATQVDEPLLVRGVDRIQREQRDVVIIVGTPGSPELAGRLGHARVLLASSRGRQGVVVISSTDRTPGGPIPARPDGRETWRELVALAGADPTGARGSTTSAGKPRGRDSGEDRGEDRGEDGRLVQVLANRLTAAGHRVHTHFGSGTHRVDLAVEDPRRPGRMLLAVDIDGPEYAATEHTRQRDRLWAQQLEARGWRHLRIWSVDLFRDPAREEARVIAAVNTLVRRDPPSTSTPAAPAAPRSETAASTPKTTPPTPEQTPMTPDEPPAQAEGPRPPQPKVRVVRPRDRQPANGDPNRRDADPARDRWIQEQRPPHWD